MPGSNSGHDQTDLAEHRAVDIAAQFPDALTSIELEQVTRRVQRLLTSIEAIRRYPLDNGDEPAAQFRSTSREQT